MKMAGNMNIQQCSMFRVVRKKWPLQFESWEKGSENILIGVTLFTNAPLLDVFGSVCKALNFQGAKLNIKRIIFQIHWTRRSHKLTRTVQYVTQKKIFFFKNHLEKKQARSWSKQASYRQDTVVLVRSTSTQKQQNLTLSKITEVLLSEIYYAR